MGKVEALLLTSFHFDPNEEELQLLARRFPQVHATVVPERSYTIGQIGKAEIIVGSPRRRDLAGAKALRWLQTPSSGVAPYLDRSLYGGPQILLTNAAGTYGRQIADHVMGMIIAFNHHFLEFHDQMKRGEWKWHIPPKDLWDCTILVIGLGDLGNNVAMRAKAHGMRVLAIKRTVAERPMHVDELYLSERLDTLLPEADFVVICTPSTAETERMIDARRLGLMKRGACLINVARGSAVDQEALVRALSSGQLGSAGLDVTDPEPLPADHPLWSFPNVLITPHASGLSYSDARQVFAVFLENLGHYLEGKPMRNLIDFARRY